MAPPAGGPNAPESSTQSADPGADDNNNSSSSSNNATDAGAETSHAGPVFGSSPFRTASVSSADMRSVQFAAPRRSGGGGGEDDDEVSSRLLLYQDDEERAPDDVGGGGGSGYGGRGSYRRRRRSSVGARLAALTDLGGVNSIRSFTRSFQRAAGFTEVIPQRPSFVFAGDQEPIFGGPDGPYGSYGAYGSYAGGYNGDDDDGGDAPAVATEPGSLFGTPPPHFASLLRQHFEGGRPATPVAAGAAGLLPASDTATMTTVPPSAPDSPLLLGHQRSAASEPPQPLEPPERKGLFGSLSGSRRPGRAGSTSSIFAVPPHLASVNAAAAAAAAAAGEGGGVGAEGVTSPVVGSYGSHRTYRGGGGGGGGYGTMDSPASLSYGAMAGRAGTGGGAGSQAASMAQAGALWRQQQQQQHDQPLEPLQAQAPAPAPGLPLEPAGERPAILVKEVEDVDGKIVLAVEGQSTLPQTIFNSINVLIGVGLLSLPMGIKYAGWACGMTILFLAAAVTAYTARLLAKCMELDPVVITFSDLAFISFGPRARLVTSLLFTVELMAACVALIVLFADSLELLFPGTLSLLEWKILCCVVMVPLNFLPMRLLSVTSIIGIVSCFSIVAIVVFDGLTKRTSPGSLIQPAVTYMLPANWLTLPLSFGLLMSPWGGHSVFPNIYRDMRHPYKYARAVKITFSFTYILDTVTAVAGLLMFGDDVMDEITANILTTSGYPRALTVLLCIFIAIIPLTKIPLNARPIITTVEVLTGVHHPPPAADPSASSAPSVYTRTLAKIGIRVAVILMFLLISIVFPAFDSIMAFMGSALCFTICVTLPILFHLKLFGPHLSHRDKLFQYTVLALSIAASIVGTVWSFLPKSLLGAE